ncbi:PEP-CTERM sorting domain-containing protein [Elioraea sp.]|uniref:PEP-CTERM sorting domain-containing protein n=1 Tax=Elioraea sp. TaxID=2185103 RepID=UPI0025BEDEED|nr:PEP-CTERM sorting domain-containing protein [Elioraea sp.]
MEFRSLRHVSSVLLAAAWLGTPALAPAPASAAAIAEIGQAFIGLRLGDGIIAGSFVTPGPGEIALSLAAAPPTVTTATTGDGAVSHATVIDTHPGRAGAGVTAAARVTDQGTALLDLAVTLTATLRNDGARSFDALLVMLAFSAVTPTGGPVLGAALSGLGAPFTTSGQTIALAFDTTREAARAASRLGGPQASDAHACTTEAAGSPGGAIVVDTLPSAGRACGVGSANVSEDFLLLADFDPGETREFSWSIGITVEAFTIDAITAVPEPATLALLAAGLLGLGAARVGAARVGPARAGRRRCLTADTRAS